MFRKTLELNRQCAICCGLAKVSIAISRTNLRAGTDAHLNESQNVDANDSSNLMEQRYLALGNALAGGLSVDGLQNTEVAIPELIAA